MEKLLTIKGIKSVTYINNDGVIYKYFYTDKLLAQNIVIEFYELEREEGDEELTADGYPKYETCITACMIHKKICYEFTILFDTRPYVPTLYLYRMILDLVEIIENSPANSMIENLEDAAETTENSTNYRRDPELLKLFDDEVNAKLKLALELIKHARIEGN